MFSQFGELRVDRGMSRIAECHGDVRIRQIVFERERALTGFDCERMALTDKPNEALAKLIARYERAVGV